MPVTGDRAFGLKRLDREFTSLLGDRSCMGREQEGPAEGGEGGIAEPEVTLSHVRVVVKSLSSAALPPVL